jgi:hypothetical protein
VVTLRLVWQQQYVTSSGRLRLKTAEELPPAAERVHSPYDPEARYSVKDTGEAPTEWVGVKSHLTESCDEDLPHLVTDAHTTPSTEPDVSATTAHHLAVEHLGGEATVLAQGMGALSDDADRLTRIGLGHPEGFIEAFANFYRDVADEVRARRDGRPSTIRELSFPTGRDGLIGVQFVEAVAASHHHNGAWITLGAPQKT